MKNNLNIVFFGTPDFAMPVLDALIKNGYNVSHFQKKSLKDEAVFEEFKDLKPDLCVVAAYGKLLPARYLDVPKFGFVNVHPSLLPKYRGPSPIQTAILNGDEETGATIMVVDEEMDHGPTLGSIKYQIPDTKNNPEISRELFELGAELLVKTLPGYINGELKPKEQDHGQATFTKMFTRKDGRINWADPAQEIYNRIRALNPEPGTWTLLRSSGASEGQAKIINIKKAELVNEKLQIQIIQMEGKKEMPFEEFLRGQPSFDISQLK